MKSENEIPKFDLNSEDIAEVRRQELLRIFPEAHTESGEINFEALRLSLGDAVQTGPEGFGMSWPGKAECAKTIQRQSVATLLPVEDESVSWDTTQNVIIEGDNLEVLKVLQKAYLGKVKMIYIDPPYNTGNDFIYPDNYTESLKTYLQFTGQVDDEGRKFSTNTESSGRFHSKWMNMMYPRLSLARDLLKENGVIFISLDDNEISNLLKICDEIFGEQNRIAIICHKARASVSNDKIISSNHNFVVCYAKNHDIIFANRKLFGLPPDLTGFEKSDARGPYKYSPVDGPGGAAKGNPHYTFEGVTGYFRYSKETMQALWDAGSVVKVGNGLQRKYYLSDAVESRKTSTTWWDENFYTATASSRLKELMGAAVFDNPKHLGLIERMISLHVREADDLVVDFFGGSGTTAHAVMNAVAADGVRRRFLMVQLPEPIEPTSDPGKLGYKSISEITRERIRRAAKDIKSETGEPLSEVIGKTQDLGFRSFRLSNSNFAVWDANGIEGDETKLEQQLFAQVEHVLPERTNQDILFELMLKSRFELTTPVEKAKVGKCEVWKVAGGEMVAVIDSGLTIEVIREIAGWKPTSVVILDRCFGADDSLKANARKIFEDSKVDLKTV